MRFKLFQTTGTFGTSCFQHFSQNSWLNRLGQTLVNFIHTSKLPGNAAFKVSLIGSTTPIAAGSLILYIGAVPHPASTPASLHTSHCMPPIHPVMAAAGTHAAESAAATAAHWLAAAHGAQCSIMGASAKLLPPKFIWTL